MITASSCLVKVEWALLAWEKYKHSYGFSQHSFIHYFPQNWVEFFWETEVEIKWCANSKMHHGG